jgi:molybdopterin synthase catalytic subunit
MILLTHEPIEPQELLRRVGSSQAGAVLLFLGTTREVTGGRRTQWLDYECYAEMAHRQLQRLADEARRRWPLVDLAIVHRLGRVDLGQASLAVAVSTPHREAAFAAGQWLIDRLKEEVPIWKQEHWSDGTSEWIHPVGDLPAAATDQPGLPRPSSTADPHRP